VEAEAAVVAGVGQRVEPEALAEGARLAVPGEPEALAAEGARLAVPLERARQVPAAAGRRPEQAAGREPPGRESGGPAREAPVPGHPEVAEAREEGLEPPPPRQAPAARTARPLSPCWIARGPISPPARSSRRSFAPRPCCTPPCHPGCGRPRSWWRGTPRMGSEPMDRRRTATARPCKPTSRPPRRPTRRSRWDGRTCGWGAVTRPGTPGCR
jgi:hypothetical protein